MNISYTQNIETKGAGQVIPVGENTTATVQVSAIDAAWGTAVLTVNRSNDPQGPFVALSTPVTISSAGFTTLDTTDYAFLRIDVTTAEGANENLLVSICMKRPA